MAWKVVYRENSLGDWKPVPGKVQATNPVTGKKEIHDMHTYEDREKAKEHAEQLDQNPANDYEYLFKKVNG